MAGSLNAEVTRLACGMVKALNATSRAIQGLNQELSQAREAVLENQAAIDLLLQQNPIVRNLKECAVLIVLTILN